MGFSRQEYWSGVPLPSPIERYMTSLIIREMQIKSTMRDYLTPVRMAIIKNTRYKAGEDVGEREPLHTVGGSAN